jgi:hypothetical protein
MNTARCGMIGLFRTPFRCDPATSDMDQLIPTRRFGVITWCDGDAVACIQIRTVYNSPVLEHAARGKLPPTEDKSAV